MSRRVELAKLAEKIKHKAHSARENIKARQVMILPLILAVGLVAVLGIVTGLNRNSSPPSSKAHTSTPIYTQTHSISDADREKLAYERAKDRVKIDMAAKLITKDKANIINSKLDEIYKYKKANYGKLTGKKREDYRRKRKEWKEWQKKNDISPRYFMRVL